MSSKEFEPQKSYRNQHFEIPYSLFDILRFKNVIIIARRDGRALSSRASRGGGLPQCELPLLAAFTIVLFQRCPPLPDAEFSDNVPAIIPVGNPYLSISPLTIFQRCPNQCDLGYRLQVTGC